MGSNLENYPYLVSVVEGGVRVLSGVSQELGVWVLEGKEAAEVFVHSFGSPKPQTPNPKP